MCNKNSTILWWDFNSLDLFTVKRNGRTFLMKQFLNCIISITLSWDCSLSQWEQTIFNIPNYYKFILCSFSFSSIIQQLIPFAYLIFSNTKRSGLYLSIYWVHVNETTCIILLNDHRYYSYDIVKYLQILIKDRKLSDSLSY